MVKVWQVVGFPAGAGVVLVVITGGRSFRASCMMNGNNYKIFHSYCPIDMKYLK